MDLLFEIWDAILGIVSQIVTPLWSTLLQYIPLLFFGLIALVVAVTVRAWRRNATRNRSRVPRRLTSGATPAGMHLPDPSPWPLVGSAGGALIFLSLVFGLNLVLLALGLGVGVIAVLGWLRDAGREYRVTETGHADDAHAAHAPALEPGELQIPDGVHLPPPSPWPFLGPVGLFFAFLGLVLGPALIVGGLLMGLVAAIGWMRDANRELTDVEEGGHAEPERDPARVFPHSLVPVYATIGALAILVTLAPTLLGLLPTTEEAVATGPERTTTPYVSAVSVLSFEQAEIAVPADTAFTITFENKQDGVPHNVEIFADAAKSEVVFTGELITGVATIEYAIDPLAAGQYPFICSVHPIMAGVLDVG